MCIYYVLLYCDACAMYIYILCCLLCRLNLVLVFIEFNGVCEELGESVRLHINVIYKIKTTFVIGTYINSFSNAHWCGDLQVLRTPSQKEKTEFYIPFFVLQNRNMMFPM